MYSLITNPKDGTLPGHKKIQEGRWDKKPAVPCRSNSEKIT